MQFETYHKDHWVEIEPERLARYDDLFRLDERRADILLGPVGVAEGETILDFGCGPGYVAVQLARLGGPGSHVHAVDVNADFVRRAREVAAEAGCASRVSVHHSTDETIPLPDASVDRAYCKNVLEYVPDLDAVLAEVVRVLRPGGTLVASDSDFGFVVIEPLTPDEVRELFDAAAPAFKEPNVGRKLPAAFRRAGLAEVRTQITTFPDETGMLRGVVENMLGYGKAFGRITPERAEELAAKVDAGIAART
jgi:ubiquinone/menaquinone biosynthesis C-methylase UbiE